MLQKRYAKYLLPGVVFQSTLIGGGYASGREIIEFGARFGGNGVWSILVIFLGFTVLSALTFEFARVTKAYDYHSFIRGLIGPLWWLFDVLFIVMAVLVIAIVAAATGEVAAQSLGLPGMAVVAAVVVLVGGLLLAGDRVIEGFKSIGTVILYGAFAVFGALVLVRFWPQINAGFAAGSQDGGVREAIFSGAQYVSYNLVVLPVVLFTLHRQDRREETMTSGVIAGLMATIPFLLTFLCVMAFYPSPAVLGSEVPWLAMLGEAGGSALMVVYAIVVIWTLVETATGLVHAIIDRVDAGLQTAGRAELRPAGRALGTVGLLVVALGFSQFGVVALVAQGYGTMAYFFFALYAVPLLTVGVFKIFRPARRTAPAMAVAK